jgi:RNA polymerase sigma-70 factor, ECF subfamily
LIELNTQAEPEKRVALFRRAQAGCTESFDVLVSRYERRIYRLGYAITRNAGDAEDVLQVTFLRAQANFERFGEEAHFSSGLVRIALEESLTHLRRRHGPSWVSLDLPTETAEAVPAPGDVEDWPSIPEESYRPAILSKALKNLETPLSVVFVLRDMEGFSSEETARVLGLSVAAVGARLMRARLKLREELSARFESLSVLAAG